MTQAPSAQHAVPSAARLCPSQQDALAEIKAAGRTSSLIGFVGTSGHGRSLVLQCLIAEQGGCLLTLQDLLDQTAGQPAELWDELIADRIASSLSEHRWVAIDDFGMLTHISGPLVRMGWLSDVLSPKLITQARARGARLVLAGDLLEQWESVADRFGDSGALLVVLHGFRVADYEAIAQQVTGAERLERLDFAQLYQHASHLNGHQIRLALALAERSGDLSTAGLIEVLDRYLLDSNTRLSEVENLNFDDLAGHEQILERLETQVVMPMERRDLALQLGIRPKRGVLLYGPPGTGKTSVGRALAHRMKGRFFMIDGSFKTEPPEAFYFKVQEVVEQARQSAPSVLFVDDADTLFGMEHMATLPRYLLSLLDGIESQTASQVCLVVTAAEPGQLPPALLRSGRVELWLQTHAPDLAARSRILRHWMGQVLPDVDAVDFDLVAQACPTFTPADLRRLAGDALALYAADLVHDRPPNATQDYLMQAAEDMERVRRRMLALQG